ncbi:MAG: penicillin-binding transpeptidase domain-containing protein [Eubacteriales bacterium]
MKIFLCALSLLPLLTSCSQQEEMQPEIPPTKQEQQEMVEQEETIEEQGFEQLDFSEYFTDIDGVAVFYSPHHGEYSTSEEKANTPFSPYSTFKIMSTLIGLDEGVVTSAESKMSYNGTSYWNENWNDDLTLRESFETSCVWYYHQMLYQLTPSVVENHLKSLPYGNFDLSQWEGNGGNSITELNGFWLNSSLKITPKEQVYLLELLFEKETRYQENHVFAKTGAGNHQSWYVGFFESEGETIYFAVFVESDEKLTQTAKDVALLILNDWE